MIEISGKINSVLISNENEILCNVTMDELINPYFLVKDLDAEVKAIGNINDRKAISKKINSLVNRHFTGLFLRQIGHNKIEIKIN